MLNGCTAWPEDLAERYRREGLWLGESLGDLPAAWARAFAGKTALVSGDVRMSFAELADRIDRTAAGFQSHGIRRDDRVVLQLPNVPEFIIVAFALFRIGAKPVFALASHRASEIRHLCSLSEAAAYVIPAVHRGFDHTALAAEMLDTTPSLRRVFVRGDVTDPRMVPLDALDAEPAPFLPGDPSDVAFFLLSGGTTALPKLIPRTHDDYSYQTRAVAELCEVASDDVYLAALPVEFNFTWGCPGVIGTLRCGGTVVLAEDPDAGTCFGLIEREQVTFTSVVPTVAQLWLEAMEQAGAGLTSLRMLQIGGARLQPELAERIEPELGCQLQQVFGMAEGLLSMSRKGDDPDSVLRTQGRPVSPADEVRIADEHGRDVPPDTAGELYARGPYTLRGYYRAEQHNKRAFTADGFYRTGDVARLTREGHLVIEGRLKEVVIRGGDKIAAGEVEGHLLAHPAVSSAAVVPAPDEMLGERIYAFLVCPGPRPTLPELRQAMHERGLAAYKLPDRIEFVAGFPLTPLGKVDKKVLAAAAADGAYPRAWTPSRTEGNVS